MLKRLELKLGRTPPHLRDEKAAVSAYLQRFANHSQLKELVIHFHNTPMMSNVLDAIHHLDQIQSLQLTCTKGFRSYVWERYAMVRFMDELAKGCPRLSSLVINCKNAPTTYSVIALKRLEHLEELAFSIEDMNGDVDFWDTFQTFQQLKCIRIYPAKAANMDALRRLQGQRPDLKIIVDKRSLSFEGFRLVDSIYWVAD